MPSSHRPQAPSPKHEKQGGGKARKPAQEQTVTPSPDGEPQPARDDLRGRPLEQQDHITPDRQ